MNFHSNNGYALKNMMNEREADLITYQNLMKNYNVVFERETPFGCIGKRDFFLIQCDVDLFFAFEIFQFFDKG